MQQLPKRLLSIDVLRAVTMFLMIFVNEVSGVKNIPLWIEHTPGNVDGMGFADTIFPAFLFIVGLSLPFAINNKLKKGESFLQILTYILSRSAAMLIMGFFHVNLEEYNSALAVLPRALWAIIVTVSFFLIWLDYPESTSVRQKYTLIGVGIVTLIGMGLLFQGGSAADPVGMRPYWWGILGIIGWSYLVCAVLYLVTGGKLNWLIILWVIFASINITSHLGLIGAIPIIGDGASVTLTLGGIVISRVYSSLFSQQKSGLLWVTFGLTGILLIAAGLLIRPYTDGISKIHSTPAWVFICSGITILVFEACIYLIDIKGKRDWFSWISPAGTSTLTCYLMPYFYVYLLELVHVKYPGLINSGIIGIIRAFALSFILITIVGRLQKKSIKLKI